MTHPGGFSPYVMPLACEQADDAFSDHGQEAWGPKGGLVAPGWQQRRLSRDLAEQHLGVGVTAVRGAVLGAGQGGFAFRFEVSVLF